MGFSRYSSFFSLFICLTITLISCGPKTAPHGPPPAPSLPANIYEKLPADQTEFSWMTYDRKVRKIEDVKLSLEKAMNEYGVVGLSIMLRQLTFKVGTDSYLLNLGKGNFGSDKTIDSRTVFRADQLGLPILAYIALQLDTYKQFDIDKPILEYLPADVLETSLYTDLDEDPQSGELTTRLILSHQSGLPYSRTYLPGNKLRFINPPGKRFGYSTEAYALLRFVLETKFSLDINEIARRLVFEPFHMVYSRFSNIPDLERNSAPGIEKNIAPESPQFENTIAFYTNANEYVELMWLLRRGYYSISRERWGAYMLYPSASVRTPSITSADDSDKQRPFPSGLAWCLGWGAYRLAGTSLGICNFAGRKEQEMEYYATIFESPNRMRKSTALAVFIVTDRPKSFMPVVVEEILGKIPTPLAWLGFN